MQSRYIRKEKRIPAEKLPEKYRRLKVTTSSKKVLDAVTSDASISGFGFFTSDSTMDLDVGSAIEFQPEGSVTSFTGKIVYVRTDIGKSRIGASLEQKDGYQEYKKELSAIISAGKKGKSKL